MKKIEVYFTESKIKFLTNKILPGILLLGIVVFTAYKTEQLRITSDVFYLRLYNPIGYEEVESILKENDNLESSYSLCFWNKDDFIQVINGPLNRTKTVNFVSVKGRADLVIENLTALHNGVKNICVIDSDTAVDLFGNPDINNCELIYKNQEYKLVGTVDNVKNIFIAETRDNMDTYNMMAVRKIANTGCHEVLADLKSAYGLDGTVLNYPVLSEIINILWGLCLIYWGFKGYRYIENYLKTHTVCDTRCKLLKFIIFVVICIMVTAFIYNFFTLSNEYIPTRWSDFSFWSELYNTKKYEINQIFSFDRFGRGRDCVISFIKSFLGLILINILAMKIMSKKVIV